MSDSKPAPVEISVTISKGLDHVWACWTRPEHITKWNFASEDWECPNAINDLSVGGKFNYRMAAKDGSFGFDYTGVYTEIVGNEKINFDLDDGRKVSVQFSGDSDHTKVVENFEPESENPVEMQKGGWQSILNNFKKYAEEKA